MVSKVPAPPICNMINLPIRITLKYCKEKQKYQNKFIETPVTLLLEHTYTALQKKKKKASQSHLK